ncbi:unnamed protein product [Phyllotreta striolata]|uniref:Uncharacterized protein n=1 Tax=Phyllotreta striolata TaxID=444603 RepID=A0A9N9XSX5_PHYSR|nr:unnamed protein product [Phyllotreta striolata]
MSPRNLVPPLKSLCLRTISNKLIHALSDDEGANFTPVAEYVSSVTFEVLQDLLAVILDSVNLDANIRFSCLELLLRTDVRKLDVGMFPQFYYTKILEAIATRGNGIQHLNLKGVWARDFPHLLSELVRSLRGLRTLLIPHMADDAVIEAILTLEELVVLDISGEACFTEEGIRRLRSDTLQVLEVGMFGKLNVCQQDDAGAALVANLIENLPNLISLKIYSYTGSALLVFHKKHPKRKTRLKYLHDVGTTNETMDCMVKVSPDLENIHLDAAEAGVLEKLSTFRNLYILKLTKCDLREFLSFITLSGDRLKVLKLNHSKKESLDLSQICLFAPNLQILECYHMKLTFMNPDTYFMSLINVDLTYCDMSDDVVRMVLMNSPFLRQVVIGSIIRMTDGDVFRLCAECDFYNLEELWISCARSLTVISVELLMGHCRNLRQIGQLNGWDLSLDEIDYLKIIIASTNTDLKLLYTDNFQ